MKNNEEIKDLLKQVITAQEGICRTLNEIVRLEDCSKHKGDFTDDEIYLLSVEEYEKYKDLIPKINCWWWLRSPGEYSDHATYVDDNGYVFEIGNDVLYSIDAVRPALHLNLTSCIVGSRVIMYDFPWIVLNGHTVIAEVPIAFRRFDKRFNDYENSEIRKFLLDWKKERE